jgi:hypothetical protein
MRACAFNFSGSAFPFVAAVAAFPFFLRLHEGLHGNLEIRQVAVKQEAGNQADCEYRNGCRLQS